MNKIVAVMMLAGVVSGSALAAQSIEKMTITPASGAKVGDKITVQLDFSEPGAEGLCGIEMEFGDGRRDTLKIKQDTKFPVIFEHTYKTANPSYKVRAAGTRVANALSCGGKQIIMYTIAAAPAAAAQSAAEAAGCPADWMMKGKAAKDGSFTCVPGKGVKSPQKPAQPLACPAGTSYFAKGKTLGCEKN